MSTDLATPILAIAARLQGAEIRAGRLMSRLTQAQAAALCRVTIAVWRKFEYGKRQAPAAVRELLARAWGLDRARLGLDPEHACPLCGSPWA